MMEVFIHCNFLRPDRDQTMPLVVNCPAANCRRQYSTRTTVLGLDLTSNKVPSTINRAPS